MQNILRLALAMAILVVLSASATAQVTAPGSSQLPDGSYTVNESPSNPIGTADATGSGADPVVKFTPTGGGDVGYSWDGSRYVNDGNSDIILTFSFDVANDRWLWTQWKKVGTAWVVDNSGYLS